MTAIPAGAYSIRIDAAGFTTATQAVTVGAREVTLTIPLSVAGVSEDVTVQAAGARDVTLTITLTWRA